MELADVDTREGAYLQGRREQELVGVGEVKIGKTREHEIRECSRRIVHKSQEKQRVKYRAFRNSDQNDGSQGRSRNSVKYKAHRMRYQDKTKGT